MDHEAQVRGPLAQYLRQLGYTVLEASNGGEALQLVNTLSQSHPDLLLCNMVLPGMTARQLVHLLSANLPKHRILLYANYPKDIGIQNGLLDRSVLYMQKPLASSQVADRLQQMQANAAGTQARTSGTNA